MLRGIAACFLRLGLFLLAGSILTYTKMRQWPVLVCFLFSILFLAFSHAAAQVDPWEFEVYGYATEPRGMLELETENSVIPSGHSHGGDGTAVGTFRSEGMWYNQWEITYGLTDRIEATAMLRMAQPDGHGYWWAGSNYRLRGKLFSARELPVDLGWNAELEWHKTPQFDHADLELELMPVLEKDVGPFSFMANAVFEKVVAGARRNQGFEFGYANGAYCRWTRYFSPGVEFYGGAGLIDNTDPLSRQQHYIFPVLRGELPYGVEYNVGPGIGLTRGSDRVIMKFNLSLDRFVGALFGPSPDSAWYF